MTEKDYKIIVALYLRGDSLDPELISNTIGIIPTKSKYKGQKNITSTNREFYSKIGMWALIADSVSYNVADHINSLVLQIGKCGNTLRGISGVDDAYVDIFIAARADEDGEGTCNFELDVEMLASLAKLELPVRFSVGVVNED
jgi:hypothetical protein